MARSKSSRDHVVWIRKTYFVLLPLELILAAIITYLMIWDPPSSMDPPPIVNLLMPYACGALAVTHFYLLLSHFLVPAIYHRSLIFVIWLCTMIFWTGMTGGVAVQAGQMSFYRQEWNMFLHVINKTEGGDDFARRSMCSDGRIFVSPCLQVREDSQPSGNEEYGHADIALSTNFIPDPDHQENDEANRYWHIDFYHPRIKAAAILTGILCFFTMLSTMLYSSALRRHKAAGLPKSAGTRQRREATTGDIEEGQPGDGDTGVMDERERRLSSYVGSTPEGKGARANSETESNGDDGKRTARATQSTALSDRIKDS